MLFLHKNGQKNGGMKGGSTQKKPTIIRRLLKDPVHYKDIGSELFILCCSNLWDVNIRYKCSFVCCKTGG